MMISSLISHFVTMTDDYKTATSMIARADDALAILPRPALAGFAARLARMISRAATTRSDACPRREAASLPDELPALRATGVSLKTRRGADAFDAGHCRRSGATFD